ncbi:MAG: hypothetical protein ACTHMX_03505 [Thermomicrobiales bacterium]
MSQRPTTPSSCTRSARSGRARGETRIVARIASVMVPAMLSLLVLVGCGSSSSSDVPEDRQFASSAKTASAGEPTATVPAAPTAPAAGGDAGSGNQPANPFSTRGAPNDAFTWDGAALTIVELSGTSPALVQVPLTLPSGAVVRDVASSPSGDRFAVLTSDAQQDPASLQVTRYGRDGSRIAGPLAYATTGATPAASPHADATPAASPEPAGDGTGARLVFPSSTLSWAPSGDHLVVNAGGSAIGLIQVAGDALEAGTSIPVPASSGTVAGAWMSPRGDSLLLIVADASGSRAIATVSLSGSDRQPQIAWPGTDERSRKSVREAEWLPDGTGILFTTDQGAATGSGNLSVLSLTSLEPRVLATAGRAGPSARVGTFAVSPDGKSIAYTLETPDGDGWSFHSLWVRSIRDGSSVEISSANGAVVSQPIWTRSGLLWEQSAPDGSGGELVLARSDGTSATVATWDGQQWVLAARTAASPAASPVASPATSPGASHSTPEATPPSR